MLRIPPLPRNHDSDPHATAAWNILEKFATTDMSLPQAENALKDHFGDQYADEEWRPALDAVVAAENDTTAALEGIRELWHSSNLTVAALLQSHFPSMPVR
jgi:hypothetical protein